jgi:hypothetical protein
MNEQRHVALHLRRRTTVSQCVQSGPHDFCSVSHFCEVISSSVAGTPSARQVFSTFQEKLASGAAT